MNIIKLEAKSIGVKIKKHSKSKKHTFHTIYTFRLIVINIYIIIIYYITIYTGVSSKSKCMGGVFFNLYL